MKKLRDDQAKVWKQVQPVLADLMKRKKMIVLSEIRNIDKIPVRAIRNLVLSTNNYNQKHNVLNKDGSFQNFVIGVRGGKISSTTKPSELTIWEKQFVEDSDEQN